MTRVQTLIRRLPVTLAAAALCAALLPAAAAAADDPCPDSRTFACDRVTVPLDRSGAVPGKVSLAVSHLRGRGAARSAVMPFPGGPGAANIAQRSSWLRDLRNVLGGRDLVVLDHRGTGFSDHLDCGVYGTGVPELAITKLGSAKSVERCVKRLGARHRFYGTRETVEDVEAVRKALGLDKLVLLGVSYGTRTALAYASAYPQHVERLVLDSVVPAGGTDPYLRPTLRAIPRVLDALCRGGGCDGVTADPAGDMRTLVGRLRDKPLRLQRPLSFLGCRFRPAVTRTSLLNTLVAGDLGSPFMRAAVPASIRAALSGDAEPLAVFGTGTDSARLILCLLKQLGFERAARHRLADEPQLGDSDAVYVATLCTDGPLPWLPSTPPSGRRRAAEDALAGTGDDAFGPFDRATALSSEILNICKFWPETGQAAEDRPPPTAPTLVLAGEDDLRTPAEDAAAVARGIPGAEFLSIPDTGHSTLGFAKCADTALARFMTGRVVPPCKRSEKHNPKPFTPLELRCFVYLTSGIFSGPDLPDRPPARLRRCVRVLERSDAFDDLGRG